MGGRTFFDQIKGRREEMSKKEVIAIIILIITVVCLIVLPRLYYYTNNPADTIDLINVIYTISAVKIVLLGGLIIWKTYLIC